MLVLTLPIGFQPETAEWVDIAPNFTEVTSYVGADTAVISAVDGQPFQVSAQ